MAPKRTSPGTRQNAGTPQDPGHGLCALRGTIATLRAVVVGWRRRCGTGRGLFGLPVEQIEFLRRLPCRVLWSVRALDCAASLPVRGDHRLKGAKLHLSPFECIERSPQ